MNLRHIKRDRDGFTLIELLMVIAIIGVLISLLMAAVMKITGKGEEVAARTDISQLSQGIQAFMAKSGLKDPPPSRLFLSNVRDDYFLPAPNNGQFKSPFHQDSFEYLMRLWPRLNWTDPLSPVNWGGLSGVELQGQECLVFFLGGIPTQIPTPGCLGFSTNPRNPTAPGGDRVTFFDFKPSRLVDPDFAEGTANGFFSYKDAFEKAPYAYFSSYKTGNRYNRYFTGPASTSDCAKLTHPTDPTLQVWPYAYVLAPNASRYLNPDNFQIISAGQDGVFGPGSRPPNGIIWVPKQPMYQVPKSNESGNGYDDMANFHDKLLGIPD